MEAQEQKIASNLSFINSHHPQQSQLLSTPIQNPIIHPLVSHSNLSSISQPFVSKQKQIPAEKPLEIDEHSQTSVSADWCHLSDLPAFESSQQNSLIFNRQNHCVFSYKNSVYFYGGTENPNLTPTKPKQTLWNSFHKFNINYKQFSKQNLPTSAQFLSNISHFGHLVLGNLLFIFGGINSGLSLRRNSQMVSINIESGTIKRYESKTPIASIPTARLNPLLAAIEKSVLLLFGGEVYNQDTDTYEYCNDMYTFKIETKTWTKIQQGFHLKFPLLYKPSLVHFSDFTIFLFGGQRQVLGNDGSGSKLVDNNQVYKIRIVTKTVNCKSDCVVRKVFSTNSIPKGDKILKVFKYFDRGMFVVTLNQNQQLKFPKLWFFDPFTLVWLQVKQNTNGLNVFPSFESQFGSGYQKIAIFQKDSKIYELNFNQAILEATIKSKLNFEQMSLCSLCSEENLQNNFMKNQIPSEQLEQYGRPLEFPFAAIGLLVDNTLLTNSKNCNLYFNYGILGKQSGQNRTKYILIEDNGQPHAVWNAELKPLDFLGLITNFYSANITQEMIAEEDNTKTIAKNLKQINQKQKSLQKQFAIFLKNQNKAPPNLGTSSLNPNFHFKNQKDFQREQHEYIQAKQRLQHKQKMLQLSKKRNSFCTNLKLAALRLGDTLVYACKHKKNEENEKLPLQKEIRRYFIMRKEKDSVSNRYFYVCYAFVTDNGNAADPKMESNMKFVNKEFKKQLRIVNERLKLMNNVVLITDLKCVQKDQKNSETQNCYGLRFKRKQNDVYYGPSAIISSLEQKSSSRIGECCDISLKAYLGMLYLGREGRDEVVLYLSIKQNQLELVNSQPFLPSIDRLLSSKRIVQISKCLDFADECSVVQIYWCPDIYPNNDTLENQVSNLGFVLNGVLIYHESRLITRFEIDLGKLLEDYDLNVNYGSIFGYLQIKPEYAINQYSTQLLFPRAFEKYFSRLKFVTEFMQNKYRDKRLRNKGDDGSGYQKISKRTKHSQ